MQEDIKKHLTGEVRLGDFIQMNYIRWPGHQNRAAFSITFQCQKRRL